MLIMISYETIKRNSYAEKGHNTTVKNISIVLNNHGRNGLLSFLISLPFQFYVI